MNKEINKLIQTHRSNLWKEKLNENWNHKINSAKFWKILNNLSNKKPSQQANRTIKFKNSEKITAKDISEGFNHQFTNITKHTTKKIYRKIDKKTKSLTNDQNYRITASSSSSSFNVYLVVSAHVRVRRFPAILSFHNSRS